MNYWSVKNKILTLGYILHYILYIIGTLGGYTWENMSFNLKKLIANDLNNTPLLVTIQKIDNNSKIELFQSLIDEYSQLTSYSVSYHKAFLSVATSIIQQRRIYFCLTRRSLRTLILNNPNFPEGVDGLFSNTYYALTIAKLIKFGLFELVQEGDVKKRTAAIYKVTHPEIFEYLKPLVDQKDQWSQCVNYNQRKVVSKF